MATIRTMVNRVKVPKRTEKSRGKKINNKQQHTKLNKIGWGSRNERSSTSKNRLRLKCKHISVGQRIDNNNNKINRNGNSSNKMMSREVEREEEGELAQNQILFGLKLMFFYVVFVLSVSRVAYFFFVWMCMRSFKSFICRIAKYVLRREMKIHK